MIKAKYLCTYFFRFWVRFAKIYVISNDKKVWIFFLFTFYHGNSPDRFSWRNENVSHHFIFISFFLWRACHSCKEIKLIVWNSAGGRSEYVHSRQQKTNIYLSYSSAFSNLQTPEPRTHINVCKNLFSFDCTQYYKYRISFTFILSTKLLLLLPFVRFVWCIWISDLYVHGADEIAFIFHVQIWMECKMLEHWLESSSSHASINTFFSWTCFT